VADLPPRTRRRRVAAWAAWDAGGAAFNAVITTFVFTVYLTKSFVDPTVKAAGEDAPDGSAAAQALADAIDRNSQWLGWGLAIAGLVIALLAPVTGARSDETGRRRFWLGVHTGVVVLVSAALFFVQPAEGAITRYLLLGIALLSVGNIFFELAAVNYNAMLSQVSTPANVGRVSGLGWGSGYLGGIVLLLVLFAAFIQPDVGLFGVTSENGLNVRVAMLVAALWMGVLSLPVLLAVPEVEADPAYRKASVVEAYRELWRDVMGLWRDSRDTLRFLLASAIYRDGLAGVFTFGGVVAAGTFGFSQDEVILFAIAANVVAGVATISSGWLDDRLGPKTVVVGSLVGLLVAATGVFALHAGGSTVFWVCGLGLSAFVGPAQSASRTLLARTIPAGRESEIFGLYATTGRAASFIAPLAWSAFISLGGLVSDGGVQYWGILGIMLVLAVGLVLLLPVRLGGRERVAAATA
jgi:UMF1 family MFS transporter